MIRCTRPATWPAAVCIAVGLALGLLAGLVGCDMPETVAIDGARAREAHARLHPEESAIDHRPMPMVTGPVSTGVYVE